MCVCVCVCVCVRQVRIDETNNKYRDTVLGVVTSSPDTVTLSENFIRLLPDLLCVWPLGRYVFGQQVRARCLLNWLLACLVRGLV